MKIQTLLILNQLVQNIQKLHISYPRLTEKGGSNNSFYSDTKKWKFFKQKKCKNNKKRTCFKASTYNIENLDSFNPEQQLKDTEFGIKSKLLE